MLYFLMHVILKISPEETVKFVTKGKANDMFLNGNWAENYISWKAFYKL